MYDSFESDAVIASGVVPMPNVNTEQNRGGHYIVGCGYDDAAQTFLFRNSWGDAIGMGGYETIPYAYILDPDLADDFMVVQQVE